MENYNSEHYAGVWMKRGPTKGLKLDPAYTVSLGFGSRKVIGELEARMLRAVDQSGSFSEAARTLSLSYAFLWNSIAQVEKSVGEKIVHSERGGAKGGRAELTRQGKQLLQAYSELDSRVRQFISGKVQSEAYSQLAERIRPNLSFIGSHCLVVEKAFHHLHEKSPGLTYQVLNVGSWAGLTAMMLRQADIAGIHILDETEHTYNQPLIAKFGLSRSCALIRGYRRQQCLMVRRGNPKGIRAVDDLLRCDVKLANRNLGSGTRILLDGKLQELARTKSVDFEKMAKRIRGYGSEMMTHKEVANAVTSRQADVGIGLTLVAVQERLDFVPIAEESYDFLVEKRVRRPYVRDFFNVLRSKEFQREVEATPGIKFSRQTGRIIS